MATCTCHPEADTSDYSQLVLGPTNEQWAAICKLAEQPNIGRSLVFFGPAYPDLPEPLRAEFDSYVCDNCNEGGELMLGVGMCAYFGRNTLNDPHMTTHSLPPRISVLFPTVYFIGKYIWS